MLRGSSDSSNLIDQQLRFNRDQQDRLKNKNNENAQLHESKKTKETAQLHESRKTFVKEQLSKHFNDPDALLQDPIGVYLIENLRHKLSSEFGLGKIDSYRIIQLVVEEYPTENQAHKNYLSIMSEYISTKEEATEDEYLEKEQNRENLLREVACKLENLLQGSMNSGTPSLRSLSMLKDLRTGREFGDDDPKKVRRTQAEQNAYISHILSGGSRKTAP